MTQAWIEPNDTAPEAGTWRLDYRDAGTGNAWRDWGWPLMSEPAARNLLRHRETVSAELGAPYVFRIVNTAHGAA